MSGASPAEVRAASRATLLRAGAALASFDALMTLWGAGAWPGSAPWPTWGTALAAPFAFYALLVAPVWLWAPARLTRAVAYGLFALRHLGFLFVQWKWARVAGDWELRWAVGVAVSLAIFFLPGRRHARACAAALAAGVPVGALCLGAFLFAREQPTRGAAAASPPPAGAPNLVLISWDTIRADVLPLYGGTHLSLPTLEEFAARNLVFDDAVASTPITGPSHATMLTGVLPPTHGLRANILDLISDEAQTLPELLTAAGWRTGGFVAAYPLRGRFGFARGFEVYDDRIEQKPLSRLQDLGFMDAGWLAALGPFVERVDRGRVPGATINARASAWLDGLPAGAPFFLFVHYFDAHGPFRPVEPHASAQRAAIGAAQPPAADPRDADHMALYRAAIAGMDGLLADLLARLERADPGLHNTLILFTSDHGECFGEGGILHNHTGSLYEATQHVPLVLHLPAGANGAAAGDGANGAAAGDGAGRRVAQTVTHLDVAPTFLAAAGLDAPAAWEHAGGLPLQLAARAEGLGPASRPVYLEAQHFNLPVKMMGWRAGEWKVIDRDDGSQTLWRFREDETRDRAGDEPEVTARLLGELRAFFAALPRGRQQRVETSDADRAALSELGYAE